MRTRSAEREAEAAPHPAAAKPHRKKPLTVWRALTGNDPRVIFPVYAAWLIVLSWMCDLPIWQRLLAFYIGVLYETWLEFCTFHDDDDLSLFLVAHFFCHHREYLAPCESQECLGCRSICAKNTLPQK
jgi:hypothetical protein